MSVDKDPVPIHDSVKCALAMHSPLSGQQLFRIKYATRNVLIECGSVVCAVTFTTNPSKVPAHVYTPPKAPDATPTSHFRLPSDDDMITCRNAMYLIMRQIRRAVDPEQLAIEIFNHLSTGVLKKLGIKWNTFAL